MFVQPKLVECTVCKHNVAFDAPTCPSCGTSSPAVVKEIGKTLAEIEFETGGTGETAVSIAKSQKSRLQDQAKQENAFRKQVVEEKRNASQKWSIRLGWVSFGCFLLFGTATYRVFRNEPLNFGDLTVAGFSFLGFVLFYFLSSAFSTTPSG